MVSVGHLPEDRATTPLHRIPFLEAERENIVSLTELCSQVLFVMFVIQLHFSRAAIIFRRHIFITYRYAIGHMLTDRLTIHDVRD